MICFCLFVFDKKKQDSCFVLVLFLGLSCSDDCCYIAAFLLTLEMRTSLVCFSAGVGGKDFCWEWFDFHSEWPVSTVSFDVFSKVAHKHILDGDKWNFARVRCEKHEKHDLVPVVLTPSVSL